MGAGCEVERASSSSLRSRLVWASRSSWDKLASWAGVRRSARGVSLALALVDVDLGFFVLGGVFSMSESEAGSSALRLELAWGVFFFLCLGG